jgi:hypothetical protein
MAEIFFTLDKFLVIETLSNGNFRRIWIFHDINESLKFRQLMADQYKELGLQFHCQRSSKVSG